MHGQKLVYYEMQPCGLPRGKQGQGIRGEKVGYGLRGNFSFVLSRWCLFLYSFRVLIVASVCAFDLSSFLSYDQYPETILRAFTFLPLPLFNNSGGEDPEVRLRRTNQDGGRST
jgi:hypothetical protein